jgi:hypothetical protein
MPGICSDVPRSPRVPRFGTAALVPLALAAVAALPAPGAANDRHFTFTYESAVLPPGGRELEVWTTPRVGREEFFVRFDQRIEFEVGLTERLMTAFYLNASATNAEIAPDDREHEWEFEGVSSEWKLKLSDPVADGVGVALYGEVTGGPTELEAEAKLILDKQVGGMLLAANVVGANEWDYSGPETETEQELELDLGAAWRVRPAFSVGLEIRNHNEVVDGEWEHSALFAGPVFAYATEDWWVAATVLPQLPALKKEGENGDRRILDEHEKLIARLLFSFHL